MNAPRKLAAILAADIAGYSRLMGIDEAGTAKALREHRAAIRAAPGRYGPILSMLGNGGAIQSAGDRDSVDRVPPSARLKLY